MISTNRVRRLLTVCSVATALLLAAGPTIAQKNKVIDRYNIIAQGTGHYGLPAGRASRLELVVYRWTTADERTDIIKTLGSDDGKAVIKYLEGLDVVGRIMIPGESGVDLRYLWNVEQDDKNYVIGMSQRSLLSQPGATTGDAPYYLAVLQLELDKEGKGKGVLAPGIHPTFHSNGTVNIESTIASSVELTSATRKK